MKSRNLFSPRKLVLMALFAAISIILTRFLSLMLFGGTVRLGFGSIPLIFAGMVLGPVAGGVTGIVADMLGVLTIPQGTFHFGFTVSSMLTGIIPGIVVLLFKNREFLAVFISNLFVYFVVSLLLNTLWLTQLYGSSFFVLLPTRILWQGVITAVSIGITFALIKNTKNLLKDFDIGL